MTAQEIVQCVARMQASVPDESELVAETASGVLRYSALCRELLASGADDECASWYAEWAAHEARLLLRWTGEIPDGE